METTEKIYCYDRPDNNSALWAATMANSLRGYNNGYGNDPMAMMAMMNGGMNGQWNNPFIYLVWMMFAQRMWNNNGNGWGNGNGQVATQGIEVQAQLNAIREQMSNNQNSNLLMDAIKGNATAIGQLASNMNCDFKALQGAVCDVRGGIDRLAGQVGFSAERVINAVQMGDMNIVQQLQNCCCQTKELVQQMGYENRLGQKDIQFTTQQGFCQTNNALQQGFCGINNALQQGFSYTNTGLERGFSAVAYAQQQQTCDIIKNNDSNTQRIIDTLSGHWRDELAGKLQKAEFENSQLKQNQYLASLINGGCGCTGGNGSFGV